MEKIASFTVNHLLLIPGIYVSRKDKINNEVITTFDIRITAPNKEPVLSTATIHTIEHLGASFLRNDISWKDKILYWGPMGCRTGFYLLLGGNYSSQDIVDLIKRTFEFIVDYDGPIIGASPMECGNYSDMDLSSAKIIAQKYLESTLYCISKENLTYP